MRWEGKKGNTLESGLIETMGLTESRKISKLDLVASEGFLEFHHNWFIDIIFGIIPLSLKNIQAN